MAALINPDNHLTSKWQNEAVQAGRILAIQIMFLKITGPDDVAGAFETR